MPDLTRAARQARTWACYDCGKCTAACPVARSGGGYSPRRQVLASNCHDRDRALGAFELFKCLTCSLCELRCPAEVAYTDLVRELRALSFTEGVEPDCPHGGALQSVMRMMAAGGTQQDRLAWLDGDLRSEPVTGPVFLWTGCASYYDAFFPEFRLRTLEASRAAVRVLNRLGVAPVVSADERCCGHDLLWNGDRKNFEALARHNVALVAASGAETLVTPCAECLRTWKVDYAPFVTGRAPRMLHLSEYLAEHLGELPLKEGPSRRVTFQDPCRLGRHLGVYEPPRAVLGALPGVELAEMRHTGRAATCCAGGTWSHCDRYAKRVQVERLREARATGAELLVTACPKCRIHFQCAMKDPNLEGEIAIEMCDVGELVADALA